MLLCTWAGGYTRTALHLDRRLRDCCSALWPATVRMLINASEAVIVLARASVGISSLAAL
jgi:hypothetical protein